MQTPPTDQWSTEAGRGTQVRELATLFLRLGLTAFGGPAAHVAMQSALKTKLLIAAGLVATAIGFAGAHELAILFGAGACVALIRSLARRKPPQAMSASLLATFAAGPAGQIGLAAAPVAFGLWPLFLFFFKVGTVLFGSGYVLLAFLRADLVERWHWLTEAQLLDAVAVGQVTPGPVFTTATFIGYVLGGTFGALVAIVGIFLPAFFFVAISGPLVPRLRRSVVAGDVLDGVNVGSLALMAVVTAQLGTAAVMDVTTLLLAAVSGVLLVRYRVNSAWLVLGGALVGVIARAIFQMG